MSMLRKTNVTRLSRAFSAIAASIFATVFASASALVHAQSGVTANEILIGQDIDLSGPVSVRMKPLIQAADAYFAEVNNAGGVNGRKIRIVRMDSANKPDQTKANIADLVEKQKVFAVWGLSGTGNTTAALPYLTEKRVPLIASTSGAEPFYAKTHPFLINVKASYADEIARMAEHFRTTGIRKVGVLYVDNGFGRESLKSAQAMLAQGKFDVAGIASFKEDGSDADAAVAPIAKAVPQAVMLLTIAGPAPKVIDAYIKAGAPAQFFALSVVSSDALYKALGDRSRGIIVTQTVPFAWDVSAGIVREYQALMAKLGVKEYSMSGVEGVVFARMLVEGLRGAGKNPTREKLIEAYEKMNDKDIGGMKFDYGPDDHNGSKLVLITMIGRDGRLIK
jgi:branched-chain amino acid transport system substrate-binding protein